MTVEEICAIRLCRQHLTAPADRLTVVRDLCGLQAQFTVNVRHALAIRCGEPLDGHFGAGLVKNWTLRGTVHAFAACDLPLFKHGSARYRSRDWSDYRPYSSGETRLSAEQHCRWADFILAQVEAGNGEREALKAACAAHGMTRDEMDCIFDAWGGGMRELCERGFLNYAVEEKKVFVCCPPFVPMETPDAEREMMRRYLAHYAPATLRDMAYFFGWPQAKCRAILGELPHQSETVDGRQYFWSDALPDAPAVSRCLFLAGFDPLMLGYRKEDNPFLPPEHLRGIFNLAGIVMPAILFDGRVIGRWKYKQGRLTATCFAMAEPHVRTALADAAEQIFPDLRRLDFAD
ncbi:MAG: AlkZ family DNA glycosylase [Clostridia bacterium]|nr:AlkZ family DNA glycosylase [Clostridia bacterium]